MARPSAPRSSILSKSFSAESSAKTTSSARLWLRFRNSNAPVSMSPTSTPTNIPISSLPPRDRSCISPNAVPSEPYVTPSSLPLRGGFPTPPLSVAYNSPSSRLSAPDSPSLANFATPMSLLLTALLASQPQATLLQPHSPRFLTLSPREERTRLSATLATMTQTSIASAPDYAPIARSRCRPSSGPSPPFSCNRIRLSSSITVTSEPSMLFERMVSLAPTPVMKRCCNPATTNAGEL